MNRDAILKVAESLRCWAKDEAIAIAGAGTLGRFADEL